MRPTLEDCGGKSLDYHWDLRWYWSSKFIWSQTWNLSRQFPPDIHQIFSSHLPRSSLGSPSPWVWEPRVSLSRSPTSCSRPQHKTTIRTRPSTSTTRLNTRLAQYFFLLGAPVSEENFQDLRQPFSRVGSLQVLTERYEVFSLPLKLVGRVNFGRHHLQYLQDWVRKTGILTRPWISPSPGDPSTQSFWWFSSHKHLWWKNSFLARMPSRRTSEPGDVGRAWGSGRDWSSVAAGQTDLIWSFNAASTSRDISLPLSPSLSHLSSIFHISFHNSLHQLTLCVKREMKWCLN